MLTVLNLISLILVLVYAAQTGWLGESVQFMLQNDEKVNEQYDRELLLAIALVQAGKGDANFTGEGFIKINTEESEFTIYGSDYRNDQFGTCYRHMKNNYYNQSNTGGTLSLNTRRYLREFKESYLKIRDPSSVEKPLFSFKKEKVTIK